MKYERFSGCSSCALITCFTVYVVNIYQSLFFHDFQTTAQTHVAFNIHPNDVYILLCNFIPRLSMSRSPAIYNTLQQGLFNVFSWIQTICCYYKPQIDLSDFTVLRHKKKTARAPTMDRHTALTASDNLILWQMTCPGFIQTSTS